MTAGLTRRELLGVGTVLMVGAAAGVTTACASKDAEKPEAPTWAFGEEGAMGARVLVGYATKTGSTAGVARRIGEVLGERGLRVDVRPMAQTKSLDGYDMVIVGSAVNGGAWLPEAIGFVEQHGQALRALPVAAFCVHILNAGDSQGAATRRMAYLDNVRSIVEPIEEAFFLGKGPDKDANLFTRLAFRAFGGAGEGDCRDWDAISEWARALRMRYP